MNSDSTKEKLGMISMRHQCLFCIIHNVMWSVNHSTCQTALVVVLMWVWVCWCGCTGVGVCWCGCAGVGVLVWVCWCGCAGVGVLVVWLCSKPA